MLFNNKPVSQLEEQDLLEIVARQEIETKTLEFKREISINTDAEKKEFLYDVTSFANASGGIIFYGIDETEGVASSIRGINDINPDKEKLKIENILRSAVTPRIPGISIHSVELSDNSFVLIIAIPKSWASPHMVAYKNNSRFFTRHSTGKYQMDVQEIRQAFLLTENISSRVKEFRTQRLSDIISGEIPIPMKEGAKVILHSIPLSAFEPAQQIDINFVNEKIYILAPQSTNARFNFDGLLSYSKYNNEAIIYHQVLRSGIIEIVDIDMLDDTYDKELIIPSLKFEKEIINRFIRILQIQQQLHLEPPILLFLTLTGVKSYKMAVSQNIRFRYHLHDYEIEKDVLLIPEILIENYPTDDNLPVILKPMFDAVWNASGWDESKNLNKNGSWWASPNTD